MRLLTQKLYANDKPNLPVLKQLTEVEFRAFSNNLTLYRMRSYRQSQIDIKGAQTALDEIVRWFLCTPRKQKILTT